MVKASTHLSAKVMQNALRDFRYGDLVQMIAVHTTGLEPATMEVKKTLVSVPPAPWDVTESYCSKKDDYGRGKFGRVRENGICNAKLNYVRKLPTVGTMERKQLTVTINEIETVYTLGKKNEYFNTQGIALTKTLETLAMSKGNKISIR
jgi:hypothetical protein